MVATRWLPPSFDAFAPSGERAKAVANIEALRTLRRIQADGRPAASEEQAVLARWAGWGALPKVFDDSAEQWSDIRDELRDLLGDDDEAWAEAKRSVLNAHYTDPQVVAAMWDTARDLGLTDGATVLEPGCGSGNFLAYAPAFVKLIGVERDRTTAQIAAALYPDATIHAGPFEGFDVHTPVDAAIGNVPFAQVVPHDSRYNRARLPIHDYFLSKSIELVRPGGLVMALTSLYTLDKRNPEARRALALKADLIGAIRLPSGAMRRIAGTDAIEDILILRRRHNDDHPVDVQGWEQTVEIDVPDQSAGGVGLAAVRVNQYFAEHPEHVLGTTVAGRGMYRDGEMMVRGDLGDLPGGLRAALADIVERSELRMTAPPPPSGGGGTRARRMVGDTELRGERIPPLRHGSYVSSSAGTIYRHVHGELEPATVPKGQSDEVRSLIRLRDAVVNQVRLEADDDAEHEIEANRQVLASHYDDYKRWYGPLNRVNWHSTGRTDPLTGEDVRRRAAPRMGGFREDPEWAAVSAIESYDEEAGIATPAPILNTRTIHPPVLRHGADTADDALAICLDERGKVELERVAELLGVDEDTALTELAPFVFDDPGSGELVPAEMYLSGDVRKKLTAAKLAADRDGRFAHNVDALTAVQPAQVDAKDITVRPGVPWVTTRDVEAFCVDVLGAWDADVIYEASTGDWFVDARGADRHTSQWGTRRMTPKSLLEACLNQRLVRIYDLVDKKRVLNVTDTAAAREMQEEIAERFSRWVWEDEARGARLVETYNKLFNSFVPPGYTGDHLSFPGLVSTFVPHSHQRAAVARILREGRTLLGHAVGAGKTATMAIACMEMRRVGLAHRPAVVVPNHMLEQMSREFLQLYPQARVLAVTKDMTGSKGRRKFIARAATGEWDVVIITHSAFERLPLRDSTVRAFVGEQTKEMRDDVEAAKGRVLLLSGRGKRTAEATVKRLEAMVARQEARLEGLIDAASKDDGVCWEESGIDYLMVDELHLFKNRTIITGVEGIASTGSKRASDLDAKIWYLRQSRGQRVLVGATATPIANTIAEAWVMQMYLQPDVMKEVGLDRFDAWAATFAQVVSRVELAPDGGSYRISSRLAKFQNVPELIGQFRRTADIRAREDLDLKLPRLRGGAPEVVIVPPSDDLVDYVENLVERAVLIRNKKVEPADDNMLKVTGDGRKAALDMRLVDGEPDPEGGKLAVAAEHIARIYRDTRDNDYLDPATREPSPRKGGLQIVFCDLSTPRDGWNAYHQLKDNLVAAGIPADEVAFIHDAKTDDTRAQLFAKCRNGQLAVLVGSTEKMGVGTNIHTRAVALHHIDCPWRPSDIEQREGRVIRQGNQNDEVRILRYATERSFDVYMWQTVERKAGFIDQVMRGQALGRDVDDLGDTVLSFAEIKALASGNTLVIDLAGVQGDMAKYERLEQAHRDEQHALRSKADFYRLDIKREETSVAANRSAIARRIDTTGDRFSIVIDGQTYTKRADADQALSAILGESFEHLAGDQRELPERTIGAIGGFDVRLSGWRLGISRTVTLTVALGAKLDEEIRFQREDALNPEYKKAERLERPLRRLEANLARHESALDEVHQSLTQVEARIGEPFPHKEKLAGLRKRYREIKDELEAHAEDDAAKADARRHTQPTPKPSNPIERLDDLARPGESPPGRAL